MVFAIRGVEYRVRDGSRDYRFDFEHVGTGWRIYITGRLDREITAASAYAVHMLRDGQRRYVCWDTPVATLNDAKRIAARWAEGVEVFRRTGRFASPADLSTVDRSASARWAHADTPGPPRGAQGPPQAATAGPPAATPGARLWTFLRGRR